MKNRGVKRSLFQVVWTTGQVEYVARGQRYMTRLAVFGACISQSRQCVVQRNELLLLVLLAGTLVARAGRFLLGTAVAARLGSKGFLMPRRARTVPGRRTLNGAAAQTRASQDHCHQGRCNKTLKHSHSDQPPAESTKH